MAGAIHLPIQGEIDLATARLRSMELATQMGFSGIEIHAIALAVSEVARNIVHYAGQGELTLTVTAASGRQGLVIVARDRGPGIADIERAMKIGFSSGGGLGLGLASARANMDEFEIASTLGRGTTVRMVKWRRSGWP